MRLFLPVLKLPAVLLVSSIICANVAAQETSKKSPPQFKIGLEGMIGVTVGKNFFAVNAGGPVLLLNLNNNLKVGVGALPSLFSENGKFGTRLGMTSRVDYKNFVFMVPCFPTQPFGKWLVGIGFGYKFVRKAN